jgi:hypothetical protein
MLYRSTHPYEVHNGQINRDKKEKRGMRGWENGKLWFHGYKFLVGTMKMFWKWVVI